MCVRCKMAVIVPAAASARWDVNEIDLPFRANFTKVAQFLLGLQGLAASDRVLRHPF